MVGDFRRDGYMLDRHIGSPLDFVASVQAGPTGPDVMPADRTQGLICDQTIVLSGFYSQLPLTIADLYRRMP